MTDAAFPDRVRVVGLELEGRHGALPGEQEVPQRFLVDVVLHADLAPAAESGDLAATVDYATVVELVTGVIRGPSVALIETLAGDIARDVLDATDPRVVDGVEVTVRKPDAPLAATFDAVGVTIVRRRPATPAEAPRG